MDSKIISLKIKEIRNILNLTQKDFGKLINVAQTTLSSYENNSQTPNIETLYNIAEKCNVSIDWLCGREDLMNVRLNTYADIFKVLSDVILTNEGFTSIINLKGLDAGLLAFNDIKINKFLIDYSIMYKLLNENVIEKDMFDTWLNGKIDNEKNNIINYNNIDPIFAYSLFEYEHDFNGE